VKRPVPRYHRTEPKTPWGIPAAKAARANREHTRCGHTQFRLGGRNRSDASRVFHTGRSQDLLVSRRALARKKSVAPPDAERGWTEGEPVRVRGIPEQLSHARPAGQKLAGSRYDGRRSWAHARLALTGRAKRGSSGSQVNSRLRLRKDPEDGSAHRAVFGFRLGCACG
jgi:hypothetical protein